jgi:hypothetical protein
MRNRTAAILICFFGGYFGTCIPGIIAFFEFLGLCFMSEREFDARFNYGANPNVLDRGTSYPVAPANNKSSKEATSTLYELKKLYEDGIITAEEYEVKRRKMLDDI